MRIGVPKESRPGERLVAATPATVTQLGKLGYDVVVQESAGEAAGYPDAAYAEAGAQIGDAEAVWSSDVVTLVDAPTATQVASLRAGATVIATMAPAGHPELVEALAEQRVTGLALDAVPRISRAQALDVLSTMSNVAGYRAVIEAAEEFGGMFTGQVTAAGKTPPATVFVIGAGVAGLAAIGAAGSLGAQVRAFDVRPEVGEQIESMGASFVQAETDSAVQQGRSADGYASELTAEQERLTAQMYAEETAKADIVITTALVRGKAPRTITAEMVAAMRPGSVIVDLAASGGGNCELTVPGEKVVTPNGVTILGYTDLTSRMARHTSQLFGTNVVNLMKLLTPGKDGQLVLDLDDVVQRGMTVAHDGSVLWPPPPVQVSAAAPAAPAAPVEDPAAVRARERAEAERKGRRQMVGLALGAVLLGLAMTFGPSAFLSHFTVFVLACFVGYYVISKVTHSLHTPLMAQTNAISGIILVGALLQIGSSNLWVTVLSVIAAAVASVNIFGGFLVAYRMLGMFRKEDA
ncbi:Re/Si-specific NAD(P)(+) transhydrogenase subunit alpha [Cellulomonas denverensis]|uniref:proton-translocating NAD(P)(+) transhydrogenase n=1 Tax=Cellulomonas denverensis TaxID=264297 RepID=A0A7X6KT04_9CELL|nr:Re/Si-specific NAD(P)(+) transhydrogenase subunit alpha [Cellulomonas denverensis]NKY21230.1 Re/Si-specific NAD(P)(+) transhydrogenase subunit alpha [Cellulomonas denverensis]GIG24522.1 NAD(P) transhydrogenase subunit alpha [Cellulomonas denverensis]